MNATITITETVEQWYVTGDLDQLEAREGTVAEVTAEDGAELDRLHGPVGDEWMPEQWDAAIGAAGWTRTGDWNGLDAPVSR